MFIVQDNNFLKRFDVSLYGIKNNFYHVKSYSHKKIIPLKEE